MESHMKRLRISPFVMIYMLLITILLITSCDIYTAETGSAISGEGEGIIRLHVIASSDEDYDQELKLKVRDEVLETINKNLVREIMMKHTAEDNEATLTIDESREYIKRNLKEIEKVAENVIRENGYDYMAKAELGMCFIPEKKYGDITFPAGNYEALNITIGEGAGENWWCVLFPPLCIIDIQNSGEIVMDGINSAEWAEGGTVKLKFKTLEIIDSLKN